MQRFTVGIGQYAYRSTDGGNTWARRFREVPGRHSPVVQGDVDLSRLPPRPEGACWDLVAVLPCGFGVAAGHRAVGDNHRVADVFVTENGGQRWQQMDLRVETSGRHDERPASWPPERFASLALPTPACIALAWDDPWLFDWPESHVVCSDDRGESWQYRCLGETNPYLALDHGGRLLALNDGFYLESRDGGRTWTRRDFDIEWPAGYRHERVALLRQVAFPRPGLGYALVVHWHRGSRSEPPDVGLLATTEGRKWRHLHVFEGPNVGDVNERHVLALLVE